MKSKWLDRGLFLSPVYFTLCTSQSILNAEAKRLKVPPSELTPKSDATTNFLQSDNGYWIAVICLFNHKHTKNETKALLAHEAMHVWQKIRELIGEEKPSHEFEAYAVQSLCQSLFDEYDRQRRRR